MNIILVTTTATINNLFYWYYYYYYCYYYYYQILLLPIAKYYYFGNNRLGTYVYLCGSAMVFEAVSLKFVRDKFEHHSPPVNQPLPGILAELGRVRSLLPVYDDDIRHGGAPSIVTIAIVVVG